MPEKGTQCRGPGCAGTEFCKAHIVPQGFARDVRNGSATNLKVTTEGASIAHPPLGIYDNAILCASCDNQLGKLDDYALETLQRFDDIKRTSGKMIKLAKVDGDRIARFVLSVIWRASISSRPPFNAISLGPYEDRAAQVSFGHVALADFPEFGLLAFRYHSNDQFEPRRFYAPPTKLRRGELNTIQMTLAGVRFMAKVDKRPFPGTLKQAIVNGNDALHALVVNYREGPDFQAMQRAANADIDRRFTLRQ